MTLYIHLHCVFPPTWTSIFWLQRLSYVTMFFLNYSPEASTCSQGRWPWVSKYSAVFPIQMIPANQHRAVIPDVCGQTFYSASDTIHLKSKCYFIIKRRYYQLDERTQHFWRKHPALQSRLKGGRHLGAQRNWDLGGEVAGKLSPTWQQVQARNTPLRLQWLIKIQILRSHLRLNSAGTSPAGQSVGLCTALRGTGSTLGRGTAVLQDTWSGQGRGREKEELKRTVWLLETF